jgi:hypothetical protein
MLMRSLVFVGVCLVGVSAANTNPFAGPESRSAPAVVAPPGGVVPAPPADVVPLPRPGDFPSVAPVVVPRSSLRDVLRGLVLGGAVVPPVVEPVVLRASRLSLPVVAVDAPSVDLLSSVGSLAGLRVPYADQVLRVFLRDVPVSLLGTVSGDGSVAVLSVGGVVRRVREGDVLPGGVVRVGRVSVGDVVLFAGEGSVTLSLLGGRR